MGISYDAITDAFLQKITEFEFVQLPEEDRDSIIRGYMKRAAVDFKNVCEFDLTAYDDELGEFSGDIENSDADEIVEILSEGMLVQWMKPYLYKQELLENALNTNDYSLYSPANILLRVKEAYAKVQADYTQKVREYSYVHGDLTDLHL